MTDALQKLRGFFYAKTTRYAYILKSAKNRSRKTDRPKNARKQPENAPKRAQRKQPTRVCEDMGEIERFLIG